jgi:cardiolipin synthase
MTNNLLAEMTVSIGFVVIAYLAIFAAALVIIVGLFDPGLRYEIAAPSSEQNDSDEFLGMLEALTDSKLNRATTLEVLTNGPHFYERELETIAAARHSVNLEAYIFTKGVIARRFVDSLAERAHAGVKINVVLDGVGSLSATESYFADLIRAGGKVAWYNPVRWNRLPRYNNRTHRELLVVDGRIGFIGGAGIADHWFHGADKQPQWRDTMVQVEGDAVPNLQATFAENWLEAQGELLTGPDYFPEEKRPGAAAAVLVINSTPSGGGSTRARMLFQLLLASAKKTIHITTPYFLPDKSLSHELVRAIEERGVEVKLLVPGKRSDILLTRTSSRHGYGSLLKAGTEIHEYQPSMIHAKVLLVDGLWGVVGSTNFDNRSFGLNDEVNLAARDPDFVQRLEQDFMQDLAKSKQITYEAWRHRPVLERAPELLGWVLERQQ